MTSIALEQSTLLLLCCILRQFDRKLLYAFVPDQQQEIDVLLASDAVQVVSHTPAAYAVVDALREQLLQNLRGEHPSEEIALHGRAFTFFIQQLQEPTATITSSEDESFYHLDQLYVLLKQRMQWQKIAEYTAMARSAPLHNHRHAYRLDLYEGYVAIHTGMYERGEQMLTSLLHAPHLENETHIRILIGLGHLFLLQSHYDQALSWYQRLLELARAIGDTTYQGLALLNIGTIYNELDQYQLAYSYSAQSLPFFLDQGDYGHGAYTLYAMGRDAMFLGRWQDAQAHFAQSAQLAEATHIPALLIALHWGQGYTHHLLGNEADSEQFYLQAVALAGSGAFEQRSVEMDIYIRLGFLYRTQSRFEAALACYDKAARLAEQLAKEHRLSQIHHQRGLLFEQQGDPEQALAAYKQAIDGIESLSSATTTENVKISLLGTTQQIYEAAVLLLAKHGAHAEAFNYVERARSRALLDALTKNAPELHTTVEQPVVTLAELQAQFPIGTLLIEYFTTGVMPRGDHLINKLPQASAHLRQFLTSPAQVLIFAITHEQIELHIATIDPNTLRPQIGDSGPGQRFLNDRMLAILYDRLIGPVEHLLHKQDTLYIVPHGPLHYVPFSAFCSSEQRYVLDSDGPALAFAPSATILLRNCLSRASRTTGDFLALGYNGDDDHQLLYAESEAKHLAQVMGGRAWTGIEPKSQRLMQEAESARWLHIASHAFFDPKEPLDSGMLLGKDDMLYAKTIIGELRLNVELVTLSACTSGLSHVVPGDELLGLQRAFLYAGAPTMICTLWEVPDLIALLVMDMFYAGLHTGKTPAIALRDAQTSVREMTGHQLAAIIERWHGDEQVAAQLVNLPIVPEAVFDTYIYADSFDWAPFMLIGRA
jgi:CHAT domain-containing protein